MTENSLSRYSHVQRMRGFQKRDGRLFFQRKSFSCTKPIYQTKYRLDRQREGQVVLNSYKVCTSQYYADNLEQSFDELSIDRTEYCLHNAFQIALLSNSDYYFKHMSGSFPKWDQIACISMYNKEDLACPICLYPPIVPRIEKCGHIYCWPCAIQYVNYDNDGNSRKCAVCSLILSLKDFKRVLLVDLPIVRVGTFVTMSLVKRCKNDFIVSLMSSKNSGDFQFIYKMNSKAIKELKENELSQLEFYRVTNEDDEGNQAIIPFIDFALNELKSEAILGECCHNENKRLDGFKESDLFYFYRISDGQNIYLDGLMWRCLLKEFGNVSNLPHEFESTITSIKTYRMNYNCRKRFHYLSHLLDGVQFSFIEIDLKNLISEQSLSCFCKELNSRARQHVQRHLEDLELTRLKEMAENRIAPGFILNCHAPLLDEKSLDLSEFIPLTPDTQQQARQHLKLSATFAEITRSGAQKVVGPDGIANFSRSPQFYNDSTVPTDSWPVLPRSLLQ